MIEIIELTKEFKKPIRKEGVIGMFKTLFSNKYEILTAVNHLNFKINDGEIVGFIGSNGAGKSTTIKMMSGILTPTSGKVLIDGLEPYYKRRKVAKNIGVVFGQKTQLWWDIPLIESFKVLKEVYSISDKDYQERMEFLTDILGIKEFLNQPTRTLSLGQRMRADLAAAWLHNPSILFLDEPTIGLDVLVKEKITDAIKQMNKKYHTTIILTTHDMRDVENLCSRIIMIDKGQIIYDGSLTEIKQKFGDLRTLIIQSKDFLEIESLDTFAGKVKYEYLDNKLNCTFDAGEIKIETILEYLFKKTKVEDISINEIHIDDIVKSLLGENNEKD